MVFIKNFATADGALLPSPTREKLEPVIPRQKEEDLPKSPQKASPKSSPRSGNEVELTEYYIVTHAAERLFL